MNYVHPILEVREATKIHANDRTDKLLGVFHISETAVGCVSDTHLIRFASFHTIPAFCIVSVIPIMLSWPVAPAVRQYTLYSVGPTVEKPVLIDGSNAATHV